MREKIILIGAGQHARVILYNIKEQNKYDVVALLDPNPVLWGKPVDGIVVEEGYRDFDAGYLKVLKVKFDTNKFFVGIGAMSLRKRVFDFFISEGWDSVNIIHPDAIVSPLAKLGSGILIEAGCLITPSPEIGDNVVINTGSQVNHDNRIGNHVYIASGVVLSGGVSIGDNTLVDDGVIVTLGRKVGINTIIGAGSIVTKDIPDFVIAYGSPCKIVRDNK